MWFMRLQHNNILTLKLLQYFHFYHVKGVVIIYRYTQLEKHAKIPENMKYTCREYGMGEELSLALMYSGIKYMFNFDLVEVVTG